MMSLEDSRELIASLCAVSAGTLDCADPANNAEYITVHRLNGERGQVSVADFATFATKNTSAFDRLVHLDKLASEAIDAARMT